MKTIFLLTKKEGKTKVKFNSFNDIKNKLSEMNVNIHEDVLFGNNITISEYVTIECGCKIGHNVKLFRAARIRKNCIIGDNAYIGNCVEISENSNVMYGAEIKWVGSLPKNSIVLPYEKIND